MEWLVADGDQVTEGQPIYLIETDKVENEVEATASGTVRITGEEGETYPVGERSARSNERDPRPPEGEEPRR